MASPALVGRRYALPRRYDVGAEKLREFADAVGITAPECHDELAARALGHPGIVAAPTFAAVIAQRAEALYVADPEAGVDFTHVLHAEEAITSHRPIVAGDLISAECELTSVTERAALTFVTTTTRLSDAAGRLVAEVASTLAIRGEGR